MEFLSNPVPAAIVLLGLLVLIHEAGHFIVGKLCGIGVEVFSIGFGPRIIGFTHKGTSYRLSWIPLGGYVKFVGATRVEEVPEHLKGREFYRAAIWKRMLVAAAGPLANLLLAVAAFGLLGYVGIAHPAPIIGEVMPHSPAEAAGIYFGDRVETIDGKAANNWNDIEHAIANAPGKPLHLTVKRHGMNGPESKTLLLVPEAVNDRDMLDKPVVRGRAGISLGRIPNVVSVTTAGSPAAKQGLHTADTVASISWPGHSPEPIAYFTELAQAFSAARLAGASSVVLGVYPEASAQSETPKSTSQSAQRIVTIPTSAWVSLPTDASGTKLAESLGIVDAELTIDTVSDTLDSVLKRGDRVLSMDGIPLSDIYQFHELLDKKASESAKISIEREFKTINLPIRLAKVEAQGPLGKVTLYTFPATFFGMPVQPSPVIERYRNPIAAMGYGFKEATYESGLVLGTIGSLITGNIPLKALGGPMLIAKVAGDSAKAGWKTFLTSMALISINLGLLNLFPIPILDGGQIVLFGAEAVRRRPLGEMAIENFQKVGFVMILALVVLATYNDLGRFWKSMLESVTGLFQ